jgi:hypothetical protein
MYEQLSIDGEIDKARARNTDPETSRAAAASLTPPTLRASQEAVLDVFESRRKMTDVEMIDAYNHVLAFYVPPQSPSGLRTRRKELVRKGFLRDSGEREKMASGRKAIVWERCEP